MDNIEFQYEEWKRDFLIVHYQDGIAFEEEILKEAFRAGYMQGYDFGFVASRCCSVENCN